MGEPQTQLDILLALPDAAVDPYLASLTQEARTAFIARLASEKVFQYKRLLQILASSYATCEETMTTCIELVHFDRVSSDCATMILEQLRVTIGQLAKVQVTGECMSPLKSVLSLLVRLLYVPCSPSYPSSPASSVFDSLPTLLAAFKGVPSGRSKGSYRFEISCFSCV